MPVSSSLIRRSSSEPSPDSHIIGDLLLGLLVNLTRILLVGALCVLVSGSIWVSMNDLDLHTRLSTPKWSFEQCLGAGGLIVLMSGLFTRRLNEIVHAAMIKMAGTLGFDLARILSERDSRRTRRLRARRIR